MTMYCEGDVDVYGLITELSKHILDTYRSPHRDFYAIDVNDGKAIKRLRSKAFAILLGKTSTKDVELRRRPTNKAIVEVKDPIAELFKHAFVLRLGFRQATDAATLERLADELSAELGTDNYKQIPAILRFLIQLKSFESNPEPITNIFHYGNSNPLVPETSPATKNVPMFQIYPIENFILVDKFEATLQTQRFLVGRNLLTTPGSEPYFGERLQSQNVLGVKSHSTSVSNGFLPSQGLSRSATCLPLSPIECSAGNLGIEFQPLTEVMSYESNGNFHSYSMEKDSVAQYMQGSYTQTKLVHINSENIFDAGESSDDSYTEDLNHDTVHDFNHIWSTIDVEEASFSKHRTWESLGQTEPVKEAPFLTDIPNVMVHLARIKETSSLPLLPSKVVEDVPLLEEVPAKEFISDIKSLFFGVESNSFLYEDIIGFSIRKCISVYGVSPETLETVCREPIEWGNCFKFLSRLVTPEPQTGKLQQEGLIFKAMCASIKELLLYYRAIVLRILNHEEQSGGLLYLLGKIRPVAKLIVEVAKLCDYNKQAECSLGEGNGILTRIYKHAIGVTDSKVALVFYSILKSCCEVYFRFLQKWLFEGISDDVYGEFMIKTRPQYLRNRGHKFWTKSFSVCNEAVPGFLSDLTEAILRCGKAVRLLKICDFKNPVCSVSISDQPDIKVCLSVTMLREQLLRCQEYEERGKIALGPTLSLASAIQEQKELEKETAQLVIRAHQDALARIDSEREMILKKNIQSKRYPVENLQQQLPKSDPISIKKDQYNEVKTSPHKIEKQAASESRRKERSAVAKYYEDLAADIEKRRARAQWRVKRMSYYEDRVTAIASANRVLPKVNEENIEYKTNEDNVTSSTEILPPLFEDENKNITENEVVRIETQQCGDDDNTVKDNLLIENVQERTTQDPAVPMLYIYKKNNERSDLQNYLKEETLRELQVKILEKSDDKTTPVTVSDNSKTIPYTELINVLEAHRDNQNIQGRPTFLNFKKVDNMSESLTNEINRIPRIYDMTPNNNEFRLPLPTLSIDAIKDFNRGSVEEFNRNTKDSADIETPMSCTTDKYTSSMQSPLSLLGPSEHGSSVDITTDAKSISSRLSVSPGIPATSGDSPTLHQYLNVPNFFRISREQTKQTLPISSLTFADVEMIDHTSLQVYLEKSIRIPLQIQSRLVNNAIIKYFLKEHNLLLHLHSLRSYFFLLNGEFAKSLTNSLYARLYDISAPLELFNSTTLTSLLERALINSFSNSYVNSEHLSLSAIDTPNELRISDPSALDCLSLNYKISWPLNIIFDDMVMVQYGKVFKFLITSGRVSWVLQEDFHIMKREKKATTSEQYHKLQLYRHSMTQFMNALQNYITCSVLHSSWAEFEKDLQNSMTLDEIYLSHVNYIKRILSRCMLNSRGEKMRVCLSNIFKVILKFHNRLRSRAWLPKQTSYVHPNFKKLEQMYRAFCELRAYMAHVAFKLATSGYQPHLMHFLNALNINHTYNLTVKTSRNTNGIPKL